MVYNWIASKCEHNVKVSARPTKHITTVNQTQFSYATKGTENHSE